MEFKEKLSNHLKNKAGLTESQIAEAFKSVEKESIAQDKELINELATEMLKKSVLLVIKRLKEGEEEVEEKKTPSKKPTTTKKREEKKEEEEEEEKVEEPVTKKKKKKDKRDHDEIQAEIDGGKALKECTIEDLKVLIRRINETEKPPIKLDGKKEDLIEKLEKHYNK